MKDKSKSKLEMWQRRLSHNEDAYNSIFDDFDEREAIATGTHSVEQCCDGDTIDETPHVRNIVAEQIEAQIDPNIPAPKVMPRNKEDEHLAKIVEDMVKDELDRMPYEILNDMAERTVPIQGGAYYLIEWDNSQRTHTTVGEITTQLLHPKQIVPQDGVYTSVEDMDYIFIKLPQTKEEIKRRFGVDLKDEAEEEPEVRGADSESAASDIVTQYIAFYRNEKGGIGKFSWVRDTVLEDLEDCQARRLRRCKQCSAIEPMGVEPIGEPTLDGNHPKGKREMELPDDITEEYKPKSGQPKKGACPYCGGTKWVETEEEYEEIYNPKVSSLGKKIPGLSPDGMKPTEVPYYKPNIYPLILQKNISVFGQLLGESDVDKIKDQQNTANRLSAKMLDKLLKAGSFATLPSDCTISTENEDMKIIRIENNADMDKIRTFDMQGSIDQDITLYSQVYEEARQAIGITDSYLGRKDTTATSGKAKEFAAQQSAGRLESKRKMKEAAYAQIFEAIFKFKLAYSDEPRSIISHDETGGAVYETFDRYDFLKQDEAGEWYWADQFLFSCDNAAPLSNNRESLWQETRMNLKEGAFGDPTSLDTLILFWSRMEVLHYPFAGDTKKYLQQKLEEQQIMQEQQMALQQQQLAVQQGIQQDALAAQAVENILKGEKDDKAKSGAATQQAQGAVQ